MTVTQVDAVEDLIIAASGGGPARLSYLEHLASGFAADLGSDLSNHLRAEVTAELGGFDYQPGADLHAGFGDTKMRLTAELAPWSGKVVSAFDRRLMMTMVNALLGLKDPPDESDERQLTRLETRLVCEITATILKRFVAHLEALRRLAVDQVAIEEVGEDPPSWAAAERCFVLNMELGLLGCTGAMTLVLPEDILLEDRDLIATVPETDSGADGEWRSELSHLLRQADVTLTAVLAQTQISLAEAMGWQPGKTIALGIDTTRELDVLCEGRPAFRAVAGHRDSGAIALRLTTEVDMER